MAHSVTAVPASGNGHADPHRRDFLAAAAGPVVAPVVDPEPAIPSRLDDETDEERAERFRRYDAAKASKANRLLARLSELLTEAYNVTCDFEDRHGDGCQCAFCTWHDWETHNLSGNDFTGIRWAIDMFQGTLDHVRLKVWVEGIARDAEADVPHVATGGRS